MTAAEPNLRWLDDERRRPGGRRSRTSPNASPRSRCRARRRARSSKRTRRPRRSSISASCDTHDRAASRSRSRAPATPATSATRSGCDARARLDAVGRADRRGHAVRHHAGGHLALDIARIEAGLMLLDVDYCSAQQGADRRPEVVAVRARPRLDREPRQRSASSAATRSRAEAGARAAVALRRRRGRLGLARAALRRGRPAAAACRRVAWRVSVPIYAGGEQVGYATSGGWSPLLKKYIALAHLQRAALRSQAPSSRWRSPSSIGASSAPARVREAAVLRSASGRTHERAAKYDAIVIGGGHNGLVCAAYLARAGQEGAGARARDARRRRGGDRGDLPRLQVLGVLLRGEPAAAGDHPRPRAAAARAADPAAREHRHAAATTATTSPAGPTTTRTRRELARHSPRDAEAYDEFGRLMHHMAMAVKPILGMVPPDPTSLAPARPARRCSSSAGTSASLGAERFPRAVQADDDERAPTISTSGSSSSRSRRPSRRAASSARSSGRARRARRTCCCITTWARSTARSAPGASRRAAPARSARRSPARRARTAPRSAPTRRVAQVLVQGRTRRRAWRSRTATRSARADRGLGRSIRAARSCSSSSAKQLPDEFVDGDRALQVPRLVGQGEPRARAGCPTSPACPGVGPRICAARSRSARASTISSAPTTTRSTASSRATRTWTS